MTDDARNGGRPSVHPDVADFGVEDNPMDDATKRALIARLGRQQRLADNDIRKLEEAVANIECGATAWQQELLEQVVALNLQTKRIANKVMALAAARYAWPGIIALSVLFLAGVCGELVWRLATLH